MGDRGGFERGFGGRGDRGDRGGDRGRRRRGRGRPRSAADDLNKWVPVTKLGRLVKEGHIARLEDIYLHSLAIKEHQIIDHFYKDEDNKLKDEVIKICQVQKQTRAGQRTRYKAYTFVGDEKGHVGLGVKVAKEVATAIKGSLMSAKLALIPVRRGYWGNRIGDPHTVPMKVSGKCGSVRVRLIPAPRGALVVGAPITKKMLSFAGVDDCYTSSRGCTSCPGNFVRATFEALKATYGFLTPDLWENTNFQPSPFQQFTDELAKPMKKAEEVV
eukprot:Selendium_serpulae@DN5133_c0_g1_i2.p1